MAHDFLSAREDFKENIKRLSTVVPGYDQLCRGIEGDVKATRIDFADEGYGTPSQLVNGPALSQPETLYQWLTGDLQDTTTRYVLVEDIDTSVCYTLGAAFDIEPQFFLDHMNNQLSMFSPSERDHRIQWNTWNLSHQYMSFHWYRPVSRSDASKNGDRRKEIDQRYERVMRIGSKVNELGEDIDIYAISSVRAVSSILRPEWDLSTFNKVTKGLVAIEERVSMYQTTVNNCQYYIVLTDAIPSARKTTWKHYGSKPENRFIHPDDAEFEIVDLYETLVPRFTPAITARTITSLSNVQLQDTYQTMSSTMQCLLNNSDPANQTSTAVLGPCSHLPFAHLFRIVISDTLGLLHLLDAVQSDIVQTTASQDTEIAHLLNKRTSLATLHAQLPPLDRDLQKTLKELASRGKLAMSQSESIDSLGIDFEKTIQDVKEASNAITGTLQFIESHRAILEAESVTRLTELAFLFIPLSFAASLFSMQIQPLTDPVPVGHFIAFAISLSTATYALRLAARSTWVSRQKKNILDSIRARSSISPGAPIPNMAIMAWVYARTGPVLGLILVVGGFLTPLVVVIWIRELDVGLKIALTLLFIVFMSFIIAVAVLASPSLRRQLRQGMHVEWYNLAEGAQYDEREPLQERFMKWTIGAR